MRSFHFATTLTEIIMSNDHFTEVTQTGWLSRIGKSITGVLIGIVLVIVAFPVLWMNEGRSVKTYKGLVEGEKVTVEAKSEAVDAANDGKLVHTIGTAETKEPVRDDVFHVGGDNIIKLSREVETYQWIEKKETKTKNKMGGGEETVTEYTYKKDWDDKVHKSDEFKHPSGHQNPVPAYSEAHFQSQHVTLSAYRLPEFLVSAWDDFKPHELPAIDALPEPLRAKATVLNGWLYLTKNPNAPELGDARVKFQSIPSGEASVLARQIRDTFEPYNTKTGTSIARIASGVHSKEAMFAAAKSENNMLTWLLRGAGFLMMLIGLVMIFSPLKVLADVVPFVGRMVGGGMGLIAFLLSAIGSSLTISLAWLWYRPLLGGGLLIITVGGLILLIKAMRSRAA